MSNPPSQKRKLTTQITEYFESSKPTTVQKRSHKRGRSSGDLHHFHPLPNNRTSFSGRVSYRSSIPRGVKVNIHSRRYHNIPFNKKAHPNNIMATTSKSNASVKGASDLIP